MQTSKTNKPEDDFGIPPTVDGGTKLPFDPTAYEGAPTTANTYTATTDGGDGGSETTYSGAQAANQQADDSPNWSWINYTGTDTPAIKAFGGKLTYSFQCSEAVQGKVSVRLEYLRDQNGTYEVTGETTTHQVPFDGNRRYFGTSLETNPDKPLTIDESAQASHLRVVVVHNGKDVLSHVAPLPDAIREQSASTYASDASWISNGNLRTPRFFQGYWPSAPPTQEVVFQLRSPEGEVFQQISLTGEQRSIDDGRHYLLYDPTDELQVPPNYFGSSVEVVALRGNATNEALYRRTIPLPDVGDVEIRQAVIEFFQNVERDYDGIKERYEGLQGDGDQSFIKKLKTDYNSLVTSPKADWGMPEISSEIAKANSVLQRLATLRNIHLLEFPYQQRKEDLIRDLPEAQEILEVIISETPLTEEQKTTLGTTRSMFYNDFDQSKTINRRYGNLMSIYDGSSKATLYGSIPIDAWTTNVTDAISRLETARNNIRQTINQELSQLDASENAPPGVNEFNQILNDLYVALYVEGEGYTQRQEVIRLLTQSGGDLTPHQLLAGISVSNLRNSKNLLNAADEPYANAKGQLDALYQENKSAKGADKSKLFVGPNSRHAVPFLGVHLDRRRLSSYQLQLVAEVTQEKSNLSPYQNALNKINIDDNGNVRVRNLRPKLTKTGPIPDPNRMGVSRSYKYEQPRGAATLNPANTALKEVCQGAIGNCWLIAPIGGIAHQQPESIYNTDENQPSMIRTSGNNFIVTLYTSVMQDDGQAMLMPVEVEVSSQMPLEITTNSATGDVTQQPFYSDGTSLITGGFDVSFTQVLEKSMAALFGNYSKTVKNSPDVAWQHLLGGETQIFNLNTTPEDERQTLVNSALAQIQQMRNGPNPNRDADANAQKSIFDTTLPMTVFATKKTLEAETENNDAERSRAGEDMYSLERNGNRDFPNRRVLYAQHGYLLVNILSNGNVVLWNPHNRNANDTSLSGGTTIILTPSEVAEHFGAIYLYSGR